MMGKLVIRKASLKDVGEILKLNNKWVKEKVSLGTKPETNRLLAKKIKDSLTFVAVIDGKFVGYLTGKIERAKETWKIFGIKKNQSYRILDMMYVLKNYRRKSVGKELMKVFLEKCGKRKIVLFADNLDLNNLTKFYKRFGFKPVYLAMAR